MNPSSSSQLYKLILDDSSSEEETDVVTSAAKVVCDLVKQVTKPPIPRLSRAVIERDREAANQRLMEDYFVENPRYTDPKLFRRRFRMSKRLFLHITKSLEDRYEYFQQRPDGRGKLGFTAIQKCTSALRVLAYGNTTDINGEYLKMAEKTTRDTLCEFCEGIIALFGKRYMRKPTIHDLRRTYEVHESIHGLSGMIGSIDCMHWPWKNCPTAWRGQFTRGDQKEPTIILQAVCSYDLWIWDTFFGVAGSNNDINVLNQSPIIEDRVAGNIAFQSFEANESYYPQGYFLGDGIYPELAFIVKTFRNPIDEKRTHFKMVQESSMKDIERCFGVLKQRFHFIRNPCRMWSPWKIRDVMYCCLILHNMILEDEERAICQHYVPGYVEEYPQATREQRLENLSYMRDKEVHNALMHDLVEHSWWYRTIRDNTDCEEDEEEEEEEEDFEEGEVGEFDFLGENEVEEDDDEDEDTGDDGGDEN